MNATDKVKRIKEIAAELAAMFPGRRVDLDGCGDSNNNLLRLYIFGPKTYDEATEELRSLGVGTREKTPTKDNTTLDGRIEGIHVYTYCPQLPPTCHLEKRTRRIPKTEVVTVANQFVEVEETVVVCDGTDDDFKSK